jgi:hypothetical protein
MDKILRQAFLEMNLDSIGISIEYGRLSYFSDIFYKARVSVDYLVVFDSD